MSLDARIRRLQAFLGVAADGVIGVDTLSALERRLGLVATPGSDAQLVVSRRGLEALVAFEITSRSHYEAKLARPIWPRGESGVTIGIGYDLGWNSKPQIREDWSGLVPEAMLAHLEAASRIRGEAAAGAAKALRNAGVVVAYDAAERAFYTSTLPRYATLVRKTYPGVEDLPADAQAAMLSLVYNRGASLAGSSRREMAALVPLVAAADLAGMAAEIVSMKRLWDRAELPGLHVRRDAEAALVRGSDRAYQETELIRV